MSAPISVIIPTYNSASLVTEAIDSVLKQTLVPAEIVVVDDGSTDDTRLRVAAYGQAIRYVYQENQGVAAARNTGLRLAGQEFIAFLDADDVWHPRKLEVQLAVLGGSPELAMLGTEVFDWPTAAIPAARPDPEAAIEFVSWDRLAIKNYFVTSSVVVRRSVLEKAGEFDRELRGPEDYDLWLRIAELGVVANLPQPLTGYRSVAGSLGKQAVSMEAGMRRILQKMDQRKAWRGRRFLRRKAYSYCDYSCAYMHREAGSRGLALRRVICSMAWFPWPYHRSEVRMRFARPRLLVSSVRQPLRPNFPRTVTTPIKASQGNLTA